MSSGCWIVAKYSQCMHVPWHDNCGWVDGRFKGTWADEMITIATKIKEENQQQSLRSSRGQKFETENYYYRCNCRVTLRQFSFIFLVLQNGYQCQLVYVCVYVSCAAPLLNATFKPTLSHIYKHSDHLMSTQTTLLNWHRCF